MFLHRIQVSDLRGLRTYKCDDACTGFDCLDKTVARSHIRGATDGNYTCMSDHLPSSTGPENKQSLEMTESWRNGRMCVIQKAPVDK